MDYISRLLESSIRQTLSRGKSILLLGARQTGKTTLIQRLKADFAVSFIQPRVRQRYEQDPSILAAEVEALAETIRGTALIVVDEVQKVPEIMDVVQDLIDRRIAKFILTGSSARKLYSGSKLNLLPGRVVVFRLDPLCLSELSILKPKLEDLLLYGSLPGIVTVENVKDKELDLSSYVTTYLEEEIRAEAVVRNVGHFSQFLMLAASESGSLVNFRKLSQEIGVAHTTIASYYQILEDCLITERVKPLSQSKIRRRLTKTPKYLFFDLGIRRVSAGEGTKLPARFWGNLFEQWVGLELIRHSRFVKDIKLFFWRDPAGPEVDWVLEKDGIYIPIEVKWTEQPKPEDIKYLKLFQSEYKNTKQAYVICRVPRKLKLAENIYALPWHMIGSLII